MNRDRWIEWYRGHRRTAWVAAAAVVGLAIIVSISRGSGGGAEREESATFEVQKGPLTISVSESGTIRAKEQEVIACEVEGQTTLIYIVEEGTRVAEGDLLVQLDDSELRDSLAEQQTTVKNAEAAYIRARETFEVTRNQAESDISLAELEYRFAEEDLSQYVEGEYKQELREAESTITLAEEELQLSKRKLEWSDKLYAENYIAQSERDADQLAYNRASLDLELATAAKALLEDFTYERQLAQLESDVDQTRRALERAKLKAAADIVQAEADRAAKEAEWNQEQAKEEKIVDQIGKTRIVAPSGGMVVYATSAQASWRGNNEPLEAGQVVRERQELIHLPTAEKMMAEVQVHESYLDKMRLGLPVVVTVDALKGETFLGRVSRIAPLPDAASMWMNPDLKVYRTEIDIEGIQPRLRTGMSCRTEIIAERYEDALYVPVQTILKVDGRPTAFVRRGGRIEPVPVEVGLDNNRMIHILAGLEAGQKILLTPPLQEAAIAEGDASGQGAVDEGRVREMIDESVAAPTPSPGAGGPGAGGPGFGANPTAEQREEMKKRFESMTPEQRRAIMERMQGGAPGAGAPAAGGSPPGGRPPGGGPGGGPGGRGGGGRS